jgi:RNA polymerase sigma factor (sigma-70 family)
MTSTAQMSLFSEQEVIFKERTGKDFSILYQKYYPKLIYFISKICKDVQKAEDISTDSFIVALEKIDRYDKEKSQFSTWLFTIARNLALQDLKIENRSISLDIEFDDEGTTLKDFIQETESNEAVYDVYSKKADILKKHISELKEPYKTVIEMREIDRMVYKDIASNMGRDVEFNIFVKGGVKYLLEFEVSEVYSIRNIDNQLVTDYILIEGDSKKTPFFTHIEFDKTGHYTIFARNPKSLSTIKSQIRNGRHILMEQSKREFLEIDEMFL